MLRSRILIVIGLLLALTFGAARAQETVTIEYWNINTPTFGGPQVDLFVAEFEAANPGVDIVPRAFDGYTTMIQTLQTSIAGGTPPDVVQVGYPYLDYVANNLPYVSPTQLQAQFGSEDYFSRFPQNILDIPMVNGDMIGMAYSLSNPVTYYNADLMTAAGLDPENPPTTIAGWAEASTAIREALDIPTIAYGYSEDNWTIQGFIGSNGGAMLACVDGKYQAGFNTPEGIQALQTWADLISGGVSVNANYAEVNQAFLGGQLVAAVGSIAARAGYQAQATFDLRATTYPAFDEKPIRIPGGGNLLVIFSAEEAKQQASWQFVEYLTSPEGFTEWTKGTGYVPLIPGLTEDPNFLKPFVDENPIQKVGVDQLPNVIPWTSFPGADGLAAGRALFEATQAALGGQMTADAALADAAEEVNALIGSVDCAS